MGNCFTSWVTLPARRKRWPLWPHPAPPYSMGPKALEHPHAQAATVGRAGGGRQLWGSWQPLSCCLSSCQSVRHRSKCPWGIKGQRDTSTVRTSGDDSLFNKSRCFLSTGDILAHKRSLARQSTDYLHIMYTGIFLSFKTAAWQAHLLTSPSWIRSDSQQLSPTGFLPAICGLTDRSHAATIHLQAEKPSSIYWFLVHRPLGTFDCPYCQCTDASRCISASSVLLL